MSGTERRREKVEAFVAPHLKSGESVDVVITGAQSGAQPGSKAGFMAQKFWAIVLTDRRVLVLRRSLPFNRLADVAGDFPREKVRIVAHESATLSKLTLMQPDGVVHYYIGRPDRADADRFVEVMGGVAEDAEPEPPPPHHLP